jgi:hypothetical protein
MQGGTSRDVAVVRSLSSTDMDEALERLRSFGGAAISPAAI